MKSLEIAIDLPEKEIEIFCRKWEIRELSLFGSVLSDKFNDDSDIDFLVTFEEKAQHSLFDLVHMEDELTAILGRKVDLVSRRGLESSMNYLRKEAILSTAEPIYGP